MPRREFMGTRVLVLPGNDVVANIALQCWSLKVQLFRMRLKMTTPSNCRSEPNVLFGPGA